MAIEVLPKHSGNNEIELKSDSTKIVEVDHKRDKNQEIRLDITSKLSLKFNEPACVITVSHKYPHIDSSYHTHHHKYSQQILSYIHPYKWLWGLVENARNLLPLKADLALCTVSKRAFGYASGVKYAAE